MTATVATYTPAPPRPPGAASQAILATAAEEEAAVRAERLAATMVTTPGALRGLVCPVGSWKCLEEGLRAP